MKNEWAFSRAWFEDFERELGARIDAADPLDPGVPPPSQPWAADVLPLLHHGQLLSAEAVKDLNAWITEKGVLAMRAAHRLWA